MTRQVRKHRRKKRTASNERVILFGTIILAVALIAFLTVYFVMRNAVNQVAADIIWDHIYIETVDVSGMNAEEANQALEGFTEEYKAQKIKLTAEEAVAEVTLGELGFQMKDAEQLVKEAVAYGKTGSVWSRYQKLQRLKKPQNASHTKVTIDASYGIDVNLAEKVISEKFSKLKGAAVDATIRRENGNFVITDGNAGIKVDIKGSVQDLNKYFGEINWYPQEAESFVLKTTVDEPDVTKEDLAQIQNVLGTFSTTFRHNNNRGKNIANATARINGMVLLPGEVMSASDAMGSRNAANGYLEAGSYLNGETVESYGGGVCQVSTTLYNAVILAELEIVERSSHSMLVDYVEPSMDAAISEGYLDLKIKNNTNAPIYIEGITNGGKLTFTVYGKETRPTGRVVTYESQILSSTDPGAKFVATSNEVGYYKKAVSAHVGMKAKLWKVVTENGKEISREEFNKSSYKSSPAVYHVGIGGNNTEAIALVKNAVATQNEATIRAAVDQAKAIIAASKIPQQPADSTTPSTPEVTPSPS